MHINDVERLHYTCRRKKSEEDENIKHDEISFHLVPVLLLAEGRRGRRWQGRLKRRESEAWQVLATLWGAKYGSCPRLFRGISLRDGAQKGFDLGVQKHCQLLSALITMVLD